MTLRSYVLWGPRLSSEHLHIGSCKLIMLVEEKIVSMVFLKAYCCSLSRLFHTLKVSRVVEVVYIAQKTSPMKVIIAM